MRLLSMLVSVALLLSGTVVGAQAPTVKKEFPRLGGMQIGKSPYDGSYADPAYHAQLARLDLVILGGAGHLSTLNTFAEAIKAINPSVTLGKYYNITEVFISPAGYYGPQREKLSSEQGPNGTNAKDWWLRDSNGNNIEIWPGTYRTNITEYVVPDNNGDRWPEWQAKSDYDIWFNSDVWDFWYADEVSWKPKFRSQGLIGDYSGGSVTNSSQIYAAYRRGHAANWSEIRRLTPNKLLAGNHNWYLFDSADKRLDLEAYENQLNGGFLELVMGPDNSIETVEGWHALYQSYNWSMEYFLDPTIVTFTVQGDVDDYQFFRYAFTTCLMNDAFFDYAPYGEFKYGTVEWFDEFDLAGQARTDWLGLSVSAPPAGPWQNGVYRRDFEHGVALVNPRGNGEVTVTIGEGFRHIDGSQDSVVNNGKPANRITLQDGDGIVLLREVAASPPSRPKAPVLIGGE